MGEVVEFGPVDPRGRPTAANFAPCDAQEQLVQSRVGRLGLAAVGIESVDPIGRFAVLR